MKYQVIQGKTAAEYRALYEMIYCDFSNPIFTFDGIHVRFFKEKFEHAFYESKNWKKGDKSVFSNERAEKILWIKDTLEDSNAKLKVGWDKKNKSYDSSRRVAVVRNDFVVVIHILAPQKAKFITAYEADNSISKILSSPDWI